MLRESWRIGIMKIWDELFAREIPIWSKPDEELALIIEKLFTRNVKSNYELDCNGGRQTLYLAKKDLEYVDSNISSSPLSPICLRRTELKLVEGNLLSELIEADITKEPFRDSFFDAVIALGVLLNNTLPNIQQSIMDINRIMKEGGILFATFQSTSGSLQYEKDSQIGHDGTLVFTEGLPIESSKAAYYDDHHHQLFTKNEVIEVLKGFKIIELEHREYSLWHMEQKTKYGIWLVLAEKIRDRSYTKTGSMQSEKKDVALITANALDEYFLNETFVRNFIELNLLSKLNLSEFEILNCKINPFKISRKGGIAAIEFKLELAPKNNNNNNHQQRISKSIVGKWRNDGRGKEIFDLLQEIWNKGFDGRKRRRAENGGHNDDYDDHLKIYEPIAYFPDYNLMLTCKVGGIELEKILKNDGVKYQRSGLLETYVIQAAKWLVKLHNIRLTSKRMFSFYEEEKKLIIWSQHLSWLYPRWAEKIHNMLSYILEAEKSLDPKKFVLIHGDFHTLNIFIDDIDLIVIDFEQSCIFDPAKDLGYFISYLTMKKRKYNLSLDIEVLQKRFLDKYTSEMSTTESLERIDIYKARSYLQHLHFRYWTLNKKLDLIDFEYWVNKAEECLKGRM